MGGGRGKGRDAGVLRVRKAGERCKTLLVVIYYALQYIKKQEHK